MATAITASQTTDSRWGICTSNEHHSWFAKWLKTLAIQRRWNSIKFTEILEKISTMLIYQSKRIAEAERSVSEVEDVVSSLEGRLAKAEKKIKVLAANIEDIENWSRRDNIHAVNLKEGTEGKHPIHFFETWLPTVLGLAASPSAKNCIKNQLGTSEFQNSRECSSTHGNT